MRGINALSLDQSPGRIHSSLKERAGVKRVSADHQIVVPEFVDGHLIGRAVASESSREAIKDGQEAGAASPLSLVELAQGVEALGDSPASDRLMRHAFGRESLGEKHGGFLRN